MKFSEVRKLAPVAGGRGFNLFSLLGFPFLIFYHFSIPTTLLEGVMLINNTFLDPLACVRATRVVAIAPDRQGGAGAALASVAFQSLFTQRRQ